MILIELTGAIDTSGRTKTWYLSNATFATKPTDTPADTVFMTRLVDPGAISIGIYTGGKDAISGGAAALSIGEIIATNLDGALDEMKDASFDAREIVMRVPAANAANYPDDYPPILRATVDTVVVTWDQVIINVRDFTYAFATPILTKRFLGNNALPNGIEGTVDDLKDQLQPRIYGSVLQAAPPCVNTAKQTYRISDRAVDAISAVYIRGAAQTAGADYATSALLQGATVAGGTYATCLAEGLFRIGVNPDGDVTCDAAEGLLLGRSAARLLYRLALESGVPDSSINHADVAALDLLNQTPLCRYLDSDNTYLDLMDQFARSIGAWYAFDPTGTFRMGRLDAPKGHPISTLTKNQVVTSGVQRSVLDSLPTPAWSVTLNHTPIWRVQTNLVGSVLPDRRAFLSNQFRTASASSTTVQTQFRLATALTIDTVLTDATAAATEAKRFLDLHDAAHDFYDVPVPLSVAAPMIQNGAWLGAEVALDVDRFELSGGKSFIVLGVDIQRKAQQIVFRLWGEAGLAAAPISSGVGSAASFSIVRGVGQTSSGIVPASGLSTGQGALAAKSTTGSSGAAAGTSTATGSSTAAVVQPFTPTIRSSSAVSNATRTNTVFTTPPGTAQGDLLSVLVLVGAAPTSPAVTPPDNTWTELASPGNYLISTPSAYEGKWRIFYKTAGASEPATQTFAHASADTEGLIISVIGADPLSPFAPPPTFNRGTGANGVANSITTARARSLVIDWQVGWTSAANAGVPGGTTPTFSRVATMLKSTFAAGTLATAGATGPETTSLPNNGTDATIGVLLAIQPALLPGKSSPALLGLPLGS